MRNEMKITSWYIQYKTSVVLLWLFFFIPAVALPNQLDSLVKVDSGSLSDSTRAYHESALAQAWSGLSKDSALAHHRLSISLFTKELVGQYTSPQARALAREYLRAGLILKNDGAIFEAKKEYEKALLIFEFEQSESGVAECLNNIGLVYYQIGELSLTLRYLYKSMHLLEQIGERKNAAYCYLNIASVHEELGELDLAMENYQACLAILEELNDEQGLAYVHNNIGYLYERLKAYQQALEHAIRSYNYAEKSANKRSMAYSLANMGTVYKSIGDYQSALRYFLKSMKLREEVGEATGIVYGYSNIAEVYQLLGDYQKAGDYAAMAHRKAEELAYPEMLSLSAKTLQQIEESKGNYKEALAMHKLFTQMRDSLENRKNKDDALRQSMQMAFNKKENELIKEQEGQRLLHEEASKRQRMVIAGVSFVLLIIAVFAWLFFKRYRISQLQKKEIEWQKLLVDEKNKEILDSINYAKRLQDAILPPLSDFDRLLGDSFVLYLPKDIVAGDFYFLEEEKDHVIFAVADCTGHGVPGAMVSVVCSNALTRAVKENGETDPGIILDEVAAMVEKTFSKNQGNVWDGMDISICSLKKGSNHLQWAGANNPLWIFRDKACIEMLPDKQPIGKFANRKNFATKSCALQKNDLLILFSDGFADQFGGPKGKKLKYKHLQQLIRDNEALSMRHLEDRLSTAFIEWKGELEQIDDVCVMGIRV